MQIPNSVKIGWRTYEIEQGEHRGTADGDLYGEISYNRNKIYLYDKQNNDEKAVTLLHEILHGIFFMCGREENRTDENLIIALSENLYQVITDNPSLFKDDYNAE